MFSTKNCVENMNIYENNVAEELFNRKSINEKAVPCFPTEQLFLIFSIDLVNLFFQSSSHRSATE